MLADHPPTRENRSPTCGFSYCQAAPKVPSAALGCPAGTG